MVGTEASVVRHRLLPVRLYRQTFQEHQSTRVNPVLPGLLQRQARRLAVGGRNPDHGVRPLAKGQQMQGGARPAENSVQTLPVPAHRNTLVLKGKGKIILII